MQKTIHCRLCAVLLLAVVFLGLLLASFPITSYAASEAVYIDETTISEDFAAFGINTALYPVKDGAERQLVYFIESCYSEEFSGQDQHYGLYLWVYNPTCAPIGEKGKNAVNFSIDGKEYNNIPLEHLSHTADHLFYKFRVASSEAAALLSAAREYAKAHEGERRYDIAGVQLQVGNVLAHDSGVSKTFTFAGYAHGCDESSEEASTLTMTTAGLETIHLELKHTTWRSDGIRDDHYRDAIHTAYFSVPKEYFKEYENGIYAIKAEWDEYKTKEIFMTAETDAIEKLKDFVGVSLPGGINENLKLRILWDSYEAALGVGHSAVFDFFRKGYNDLREGDTVDFSGWDEAKYADDYTNISCIDLFFPLNSGNFSSGAVVSSSTLEGFFREYTNTHDGTPLVGGQFSENIFIDDIDADRHESYDPDGDHHIVQELTRDDLLNYYVPGGFWDKLFGDGVKSEGITPIYVIDDQDEEGQDEIDQIMRWNSGNADDVEAFEELYKVENDGGSASDVLAEFQDMLADGKNYIVLFRFAVTDYYASAAYFDDTEGWYGFAGDGSLYMPGKPNGLVAQETVFLNFDVISLSFQAVDKSLRVIPVVADPINVIPSLIPPVVNEELDWLKFLVMLVMGLILIILIGTYCPPLLTLIWKGVGFIVQFAFWLLSLPFKLLGLFFGGR